MLVRVVLGVSPRAFVAIWWALQFFHGACVTYTVSVILLHRYIIDQKLQVLVGYLGREAFTFFQPVIVANTVVAVCHGLEIVRVTWWSVQHREWRFVASTRRCRPASPTKQDLARVKGIVHQKSQRIGRLLSLPSMLVDRYEALFGLEGKHYDTAMFINEVVEIALQIYQAYKLSILVPRIWINRLYAVVIMLNCWSTAFVHQFARSNLLVKRTVLLTVNSFFSAIMTMAIPLAIFFPYYLEFDLALRDFPMVNYYNDVWLTRQSPKTNKSL